MFVTRPALSGFHLKMKGGLSLLHVDGCKQDNYCSTTI